MKPERPRRRALLIASVGVASVSYALAGCGKSHPPGNLAQPVPAETVTPIAGNLMAEPPRDAALPSIDSGPSTVDASKVADAGKTVDAGRKPVDARGFPVTPGSGTALEKPMPKIVAPTAGNLMAPR